MAERPHPIYGLATTVLTGLGYLLVVAAVAGLIGYGISALKAANVENNKTKRSKIEACRSVESEPMRVMCIRGEN